MAGLIELALNDIFLKGLIPPTLENLAKLEWLDLSDNQLGKSVSRLRELRNISLLFLQQVKKVERKDCRRSWASWAGSRLPPWLVWPTSGGTAVPIAGSERSRAAGPKSAPSCTWERWWPLVVTRCSGRFTNACGVR